MARRRKAEPPAPACHGQALRIDGLAWWRCAWDGVCVRRVPADAAPCPRCGRAARRAEAGPVECGRSWEVTIFRHPDLGALFLGGGGVAREEPITEARES